MDATQIALAAGRNAWNAVATLFNPALKLIAPVPTLKPVFDSMKTVVDTAIATAPAVRDAIKAASLTPTEPLTATEAARAQQAVDQITVIVQAFEADTGLTVYALTIEHGADGKASVGNAALLQ